MFSVTRALLINKGFNDKKREEFHVSREPKSTCGLLKKTYLVNKITIMLLTITRRIDTPRTCKPDIFFKTSRHVIILVILEEHVERIFKTKFKGLQGDTAQLLMPASKPQAYQCFQPHKYYLFNSSGTSFITGMGSFAIEGSFLDMIAFSKGRTEGTATGFTGGGWGCGTSACGGPGEGTCRGDSLPGSGVTLIIPTSISLRNRSSTALFSIMVFGVCGGMTSSVIINSFDQ